jgi:hypothetical protein
MPAKQTSRSRSRRRLTAAQRQAIARDQAVQDLLAYGTEQRQWLRACRDVLLIDRSGPESERLADSLDSMQQAAAARMARILRSDLSAARQAD